MKAGPVCESRQLLVQVNCESAPIVNVPNEEGTRVCGGCALASQSSQINYKNCKYVTNCTQERYGVKNCVQFKFIYCSVLHVRENWYVADGSTILQAIMSRFFHSLILQHTNFNVFHFPRITCEMMGMCSFIFVKPALILGLRLSSGSLASLASSSRWGRQRGSRCWRGGLG